MRKILITMVTCITSFNAFSASYNCRPQTESARDAATLELANGQYLVCGHHGTDGCDDGDIVYSDKEKILYKCDSSGRNKWIKMVKSEIPVEKVPWPMEDREQIFDCYDDKCYFGPFGAYGNGNSVVLNHRTSYGLLNHVEHSEFCVFTGGVYNKQTGCFCDPEHGLRGYGWGACICQDGWKWNEKDKKCYPENVVTEKIDNNENTTTESVNEIGNKNSVETETKVSEIKYNYKSCSSDSVCTGIDNTKRPYLHSTAWHCAWQSAGVRVCTATACESGWTPINGYCQEDKNTQTPQSENKNANSVSNIKTETKAGTKKPCTDLDNMDSNCKCIVAGTVERGGKCVCRDDNQEIKNGKCEWTAKYVAGLESDLDSKFNSLTATIGGFEKNVWRDENGEFNTARLASDSIAGVVLGTVGGIVTANLVKKAQVKQGFEDIGCYIGGQSVAGYGDEFNVGR